MRGEKSYARDDRSGLGATDFAVNATSRRWMKAALVAALSALKVEPFARDSKHADDDEQPSTGFRKVS
ncbi:hypothetical protein NXT3_PB00005 (plasmid) [Sinorhizobium fredii]|uniref:Uncharacterized protein n=1 Tax=Rhizobium fredii TaxID=380 RepID=A0A2L0HD35_RHIFR|nr:hypothetical protein NXT3_PB00005 [Sinorhizobium fredii]